jgi:hypothetical protein
MTKIAWNRLGDKPLTAHERTKRYNLKRYAEYDELPKITCACGCGELIPPINKQHKRAKYKIGHNPGGQETRFYKGQLAWNKGVVGEASTSYKNGNSTLPYGSEFTQAFKKLIRDRDGHKCQRCGTEKNKGRALEIHHIDFDKANNNPPNLITLCGDCNIYFNFHHEESLLAFPKRRMLLR